MLEFLYCCKYIVYTPHSKQATVQFLLDILTNFGLISFGKDIFDICLRCNVTWCTFNMFAKYMDCAQHDRYVRTCLCIHDGIRFIFRSGLICTLSILSHIRPCPVLILDDVNVQFSDYTLQGTCKAIRRLKHWSDQNVKTQHYTQRVETSKYWDLFFVKKRM